MRIYVSILAFLFALSPVLRAEDPPELVDLREKYESALKSVREPIHSKYLGKLQDMLTKLTQEGNLEEALIVRQQISDFESATAEVAPTPPGTTPDGAGDPSPERPSRTDRRDRDSNSIDAPADAIVLTAENASLEGALKVEGGMITNWVRPSCRASWQNRDVPAGKYDLFFVYSAGYGQGGTVQVLDFSYDFDVEIEQTKFERDFGGFDGFGRFTRSSSDASVERVKVGTIETRGGIGTKVIAKSKPDAGIMKLKEIHLVPVR